MGEIEVPADRVLGRPDRSARCTTSTSARHDARPLIRAFGVLKEAAAVVNRDLGKLDAPSRPTLIVTPRPRWPTGDLDDQFPLRIWQTGRGTQTNMNANEVISNRAIELGGGRGLQGARSTPTTTSTCPSPPTTPSRPPCTSPPSSRSWTGSSRRSALRDALAEAAAFADVTKIGRTHLMDAVPLTLGQEFSGYVAQLDADLARIEPCCPGSTSSPPAAPPWAPGSTPTPSSASGWRR